jgi:hypothetical protein
LEYKICSEVKQLESDYEQNSINILEGLTFSQYKTIRMCEFYANSKYLDSVENGGTNVDELKRDTPFYNIVNFRVTIAKVATDLDVKDIDITSDDVKHFVKSMLLRKEAYEWMKESNFAQFLNRMGYTRAKYGGALTKEHEEDGELEMQVVPWKNARTDQVNIIDNPIVEKHFMTYADLLKKKSVWKNVTDVLKANKDLQAAKKYGMKEVSNRICVYEVKGEFPKSYLKNAKDEEYTEDDEYEYTMQQYFIGDIYGKSYIMYSEELKESPYDYLPWEEMDGRGLGRGVIEDSEEAQVWTNDAVKGEKAAMDLAGKVVGKTTSKRLGSNILEVDNGKIFELNKDEEFELLNLTPASLAFYENIMNKWKEQVDGATSSYDANTGETPPSGTPYSQTALLNQIASKPFDYRREEAGIFLTRIFEKRIIPFLIKRLKKKHILASDFDEDELAMIDQDFAAHRANEKVKEALLKGKWTSPEEYQALLEMEKITGTKRYLEMPDNYFDGVVPKITVNPTGELKNKQAILQSLDHIIDRYIASFNPQTGEYGVTKDPYLKKMFDTAIEMAGAGISPASFGKTSSAVAQSAAPMAPATPAPTLAAPSAVPA